MQPAPARPPLQIVATAVIRSRIDPGSLTRRPRRGDSRHREPSRWRAGRTVRRSARRSRRTYTSTMFGSPSKSCSHTPARISAFDSTWPWRRTRNSSTSNCRVVSAISWSPRHTRRCRPGRAADRRRRPASGSRPVVRRSSARDPGEQDRERERFGQVVVGAAVERFGLVELARLGGEHEDRRPVAGARAGRYRSGSRCVRAA